jgi:PhoPQ-activated pathogenicity-related protein
MSRISKVGLPRSLFLAVLFMLAAVCEAQQEKQQTTEKPELLKYVQKDDGAYEWEQVKKTDLPEGAAAYELDLTSQVWQEITWKHGMHVVTPKEIRKKPTHVFLLIVGGGRAKQELFTAGLIANHVGAPVAVLYDIPNQPLFGNLREDNLIAHTFLKYMETKDPTWPLLFPMTKAAVKCMDCLEEFLEKELKVKTAGFVVSGASKRGWTTWLTAAVDERVKAIAPMVYDNLDLAAQMQHQLDTWGEFSPMIGSYSKRDIPQILLSGNEDAKKLAALVDPFAYRDRIKVPKLVLVGTNDPYWPLDAANLYWDKLEGEKHLLYVPNAGHGLNASIFATIIAFFRKTQGELEFTEIEWSMEEGEAINATVLLSKKGTASAKWNEINLWIAESETRDFRKAEWKKKEDAKLLPSLDMQFTVPRERGKYAAVYGEVIYEQEGLNYSLCSNVKIFPPLEEEKEEGEEEPREEKKE